MTEKTKLVSKIKMGCFSLAEFEHPAKDGKDYVTKSFALQKSVLKTGGDPKKSEDWNNMQIYLNPDERAKVIAILQDSISQGIEVVEIKE